MEINRTKQVKCRDCGVEITLKEYKGLEGGWYTEHTCASKDEHFYEQGVKRA